MNTTILLFSLLICGIGLALGFVLYNPWGFVIDGIGFMIFLYAILRKNEEATQGSSNYLWNYGDKRKRYRNELGEEYKCGSCRWFAKPGCKREEVLLNAEPCGDFDESPFSF